MTLLRFNLTRALVTGGAALAMAVSAAPVLAHPDHEMVRMECSLSRAVPWGGDEASGWLVRASTFCMGGEDIRAVLTVTNADGETLHRGLFATSEVMVLAWRSGDGLASGLEEWLSAFTNLDNTAHLPGSDAEFPFYPADGLTDADISALRSQGLDTACYVQGMESALCLVKEGDTLRPIGVQLFPG